MPRHEKHFGFSGRKIVESEIHITKSAESARLFGVYGGCFVRYNISRNRGQQSKSISHDF